MALLLIFLTVIVGHAKCTEYIPERYLRPRNFNHHPFTDVGGPASSQLGPFDEHPYAVLSSQRQREGRQFGNGAGPILYPNPPAEILPKTRNHPSTQPEQHIIPHHLADAHPVADPYAHVPKNYAFSYSVKDQHSGDDFSHSQAHNGRATRGQYRVKLPDGRVQVVSYTADHKGYRADVTYEGESIHQSQSPFHAVSTTPAPAPEHHNPYVPVHVQSTPGFPAYASATPGYITAPHDNSQIYYQQSPSPTPEVYHSNHQYGPTEQPLYTATPVPYNTYDHQHSPFSVHPYLRSTPAPFSRTHYVTSTDSPHIVVTPRALFNAALERRGFATNPKQRVVLKFNSAPVNRK